MNYKINFWFYLSLFLIGYIHFFTSKEIVKTVKVIETKQIPQIVEKIVEKEVETIVIQKEPTNCETPFDLVECRTLRGNCQPVELHFGLTKEEKQEMEYCIAHKRDCVGYVPKSSRLYTQEEVKSLVVKDYEQN